MNETVEDQAIAASNDVPLPVDAEIESKIDGEITSLWNAHQTCKFAVQRTTLELKDLRRSLGGARRGKHDGPLRQNQGGS